MTGQDQRGSGPRPLGEALGALFVARQFGEIRGTSELEQSWRDAVGTEHDAETRVVALRRGVLTIEVAHPILLNQVSFRRVELLDAMRRALPDRQIRDIRFRIGAFGSDPNAE
jgi:hypothetical protein